MFDLPLKLWRDEAGQDIAEYAVMLAGCNLGARCRHSSLGRQQRQ